MRGANTPNLLHHRHIPPRTITEKCPVFAPAAVDYVIDRSRTQNWSRLNMPVFHNILSLFPNAVAKVSLRQIRAGNLLPHPCEARRDNYTPSPCPKQAGNQILRNRGHCPEQFPIIQTLEFGSDLFSNVQRQSQVETRKSRASGRNPPAPPRRGGEGRGSSRRAAASS